ncbi:MAG: tRNA pseudouridine(55) synthase TruB, partial [Bacteroidetes bacterium]|nr:tRNA pseudouridine(55) synthase TruB [Bacteroidota bacterium]
KMTCSKGTYVRSIAHELGQVLGVGAHLIALRRTGIGNIGVDRAWSLENLKTCVPIRKEPSLPKS